jgi:hypothetical protein
MAVNNVAELRHRVEEDIYELIRNTPGIAEGVPEPLMRRAKRYMETHLGVFIQFVFKTVICNVGAINLYIIQLPMEGFTL